ncbi:unnamed protein product [Adineta steineri]|uniref:mitogen-activated protein kinase kinase n=1 Tax=Adineta steineri TaxID=433720 RepID=A0A815F1P6_9BILA|nr:unnamed protein product [Adineta steineri]CAF3793759.1 unnamed protein product [Adineta steineri]
MANPQENVSDDTNNGDESGQLENNKAINEALCLLETQSSNTNTELINLPKDIYTPEKTPELSRNVSPAIPNTVSPLNNHEVHQPSEELDINQLHECAKQIDKGRFGKVYSVTIKNPREIRMAVKKTSELCICMELMDTSIAKFYQAMHRFFLPELSPEKLNRFVQCCAYNVVRALDFLKSKNIVHRDVKPANILINKDGNIKLCDFGICRNLNYTQLDSDAVIGTGMYLPPESEKCTIQGDMWALGITLIEIIAGKHPFAEYESYGLGFKILEWEPIFPTTVSDDARAFILKLLRKEANERPQSYMDIINDPFIRYMVPIPSSDEIDFIQHVIKKTNQ